jgi:hypothetical protein
MRFSEMRPNFIKHQVAKLFWIRARVACGQSEGFHEASADGIIRAQNEDRAPGVQFRIGEYRLDAVFAHDSIAGFRDE